MRRRCRQAADAGRRLSWRIGLTTASAGGSTAGTRWWSVTMTSIPRGAASAISACAGRAAVDGDDQPDARRAAAASTAARDRPWPSSSRRGTYGQDLDAQPPERPCQDRETGEPVGIEVAEDHDPLAGVARSTDPLEEDVGVGQQARVVQRTAPARRRTPRVRRPATPRRASSSTSRPPSPRARARSGERRVGLDR